MYWSHRIKYPRLVPGEVSNGEIAECLALEKHVSMFERSNCAISIFVSTMGTNEPHNDSTVLNGIFANK